MYNKVVLVGNLTRDIELRYAQSGTGIANTAIATSRKFTANGEKKEEVMFIDITFFGRSAEIANQYLRKGSKILVDGRLNFDQWVDQNGQKRNKHSIVVENMQMLDSKGDAQNSGAPMGGQAQGGYNPPPQQNQQQQGGYNAPAQNNSYNAPSQNQGYNAPAQQQQQKPQYSQPQAQNAHQMPTNDIPSIDIDEDEIPF